MTVVDLSMIGIEGQQAFAHRMHTLAQTENAKATARLTEVTADTGAYELDHAQRMEEISQRAASSLQAVTRGELSGNAELDIDPTSAAGTHEYLGNFYINAGVTEKGTALLREAHKIRKEEAETGFAAITAQGNKLDNIIKGANFVAETFSAVTNEEEYQLSLRRLRAAAEEGVFTMDAAQIEEMAAIPFHPDLPAYYARAAIDAKGRADLELRRQTETRQAADSAIRLAQGAERLRISAAQLAETQRQNARMQKVAGMEGAAVNATDRDAMAARLIAGPLAEFIDPITEQPALATSSIVRDLAIRLEEDAKLILRSTDGITIDQARERAVQRAITTGEIQPAKPQSRASWWNPFVDDSTPVTVSRNPERDAPAVLPLPFITVDGRRQIDVSKLVADETYHLNGRKLKWDGEGFIE